MSLNLDYQGFYNKINNELTSFKELDYFHASSRILLIENAEEIVKYIEKGNVKIEEIQQLKELKDKLICKAEGGRISNLFLKIFGKSKKLEEICDRSLLIHLEIKKIDKLLRAKVTPERLPVFSNGANAKILNKLVFEDHLYERMVYFGDSFSFNKNGDALFKFSERSSIDDEIPEDSIEEIDDPEEYWNALYQEFVDKELKLEVKGEFAGGLYATHLVSGISIAEFKNVIINEDGSFNKTIQVIYPPKELTIQELEDQGILDKDEETGEYFVIADYQYLEGGFTDYPYEEWQHLRPHAHTITPPKNFSMDIIVHSQIGLPGIFTDQGHASVKITTPNGEIYSLGLFPEEGERDPYNLSLQKGKLVSPDNYLFLPSKNYEQHTMSYSFSDPKTFHEMIKWIETAQGHYENEETAEVNTSNLFYHPTHHSCASFASTLRDFALQHGAVAQPLAQRKISKGNEICAKIKEFLMNSLITSFIGKMNFHWNKGIENAEFKNFNITHLTPKGMYLPIDLILDHQDITAYELKNKKEEIGLRASP